MKPILAVLLCLFLPAVAMAEEESIRVGDTEIAVPIPEGFTARESMPRDVPVQGMGTVRRYVERVRMTTGPDRKVEIFNIQTPTDRIDRKFTDEEFRALEPRHKADIEAFFASQTEKPSFFAGDRHFGYMHWETNKEGIFQGQVSALLHLRGTIVSVNYIMVTKGDAPDVAEDLRREAAALREALLKVN